MIMTIQNQCSISVALILLLYFYSRRDIMSIKEIREIELMLEKEEYRDWLEADKPENYIRGEYLPDDKEWD